MTAPPSDPTRADAEASPSIREVPVPLPGRGYTVKIGSGLMAHAGAEIAPLLGAGRRRAAIITDQSVAWRHLETLWGGLGAAGFDAEAITLPPGEGTKSMRRLEELMEQLLALRIERNDLVIAFGGGVIGDLAGFAAAILRRGVRFVQIPTTLLAQVDSSVGGKTGVNSGGHGKNLIGAFHQPSLVLADLDTLSTLPERELKAGYAEVAKYGLLGDAAFFTWLEANGAAVLSGEPAARLHAVARSVEMKADIVLRDETERGDRALLNLGHTFAHALEAATGYSPRLLHGEAVSIGMGLAFELSARLGHCAEADAARAKRHLAALGLKTTLAEIAGALPDAEGLLNLMAQDKKAEAGRLTFILARGVGQAFRTQDVDLDEVRRLLAEALFARQTG